MAGPIRNYQNAGIQYEIPATVDPAGTGVLRFSLTLMDADAYWSEDRNGPSTVIRWTRGDGAQGMPVQTSVPTNPGPGDYWIEDIGGSQYWAFVDGSGVVQRIEPGSNLTIDDLQDVFISSLVPLTDSVATTVLTHAVASSCTYTLDLVDGSGKHWAVTIQAAVTAAGTAQATVLPPTEPLPIVPGGIAVSYAAGDMTLEVTINGAGYSARARAINMP